MTLPILELMSFVVTGIAQSQTAYPTLWLKVLCQFINKPTDSGFIRETSKNHPQKYTHRAEDEQLGKGRLYPTKKT